MRSARYAVHKWRNQCHALILKRKGGSVTKYCLVVFSNSTPGNEEEYNRWYDEEHLSHVLAVPGFVSARRFKLTEELGDDNTPLPGKYMALYEMEADAPGAVLKEMWSRAGTSAMTISPTIDAPNSTHTLFTAITGPVLSVE